MRRNIIWKSYLQIIDCATFLVMLCFVSKVWYGIRFQTNKTSKILQLYWALPYLIKIGIKGTETFLQILWKNDILGFLVLVTQQKSWTLTLSFIIKRVKRLKVFRLPS